jgi:tetratricopeptide (TPR) repeat protein
VSTRYELLECLGEGGMGRVYRAIHHPSGATVAVKVLRAEWRDDAERRRLFLDEATAAARLSDPRIVRLLDVGTDERGAPFLVMEHVDGAELEGWIEAWPGWDNVMRVLLDVLEGLSAAHAAGIVHRDLKPANVLVEHGTGRARMLDFGVAALLDPLRASAALRVAGTPEFMAPEQLLGSGPVGPWTDLYAFGVMLAYVITGRSVFDADVDLSVLAARKLEPTALGPDVAMREGLEVPAALRQLVSRLLSPHPRQRPRFAAEVRAELLDATAHVVDGVTRSPLAVRRERQGGDTTIDPSFEEMVLPERLLAPPPTTTESVVLPLDLPAPLDLAHGIALSQLREVSLVGREAEQEQLESLVATVLAEGGAHVLLLEGEAGIGKSRLARWGLAEVERTGAMEGAAGGYDLGGTGAAGGLRHALGRLLGAPPPRTDPGAPDPALATWQWLADASVARTSTPGLGRSSQSGDPELDRGLLARFVRADASQETLAQEEIARLTHAALRALGRLRPIYLWLDDVGWSRDGALALVERMLDADDTPILVLATLRTDAPASDDALARLERIRAHARTTTRRLEGLSDEAIEALAQEIVPLAPGVARSIAALVPRSPMLLRAALREWVESGVLVSGPDGHAPRPGSEIERVIGARPIELLVASRVERLLASFGDGAELAEGVLVRAALLGARLERPALEAAVSASPALVPLLDPLLDRALVSGLLRIEQHLVVFDHGLVHEAVLARSRGDARARIDVANALQQRYGKERADVTARVALLLHDARMDDLAWDRLLSAIDRSAWAADDVAAEELLGVGERWLLARRDDTAQHHTARLWLARANAHYFALRYDEAVSAVQRARREATAIDDRHLALRCDALFADICFYQDRLATAQRTALELLEQLDPEDPEHAGVAATLAQRLSDLEVLRGDLEAALEWRERCLALNLAAQRPWRARIARLNIAEIHVATGRHAEARALFEEVLADARRDRDDDGAAACIDSRAHLELVTGHPERAREVNDPLLARLEAKGDLWRLTSARMVDAVASVYLDAPDELALRVATFVAAYRRVPHDDAFTTYGTVLLERELARRGLEPLRASVEALLVDRRKQLAAGFSR